MAAAGAPIARPLDVRWIHGSPSAKHNTDPDIQVHEYDEHTVILRQNKAINYEAPFLFLLFGAERAVLIDTGATTEAEYFPLRATVDELVAKWLAHNPRDDYPLLVLHTHPHRDHIAGDGQFADRPLTTLIGADLPTAWAYFGFDRDAEATARVDLGGGRVLECLATPGHHEAAVTYYDPWTGFLLTGDTVYPGRLYINDWPTFGRTVERLIEFTENHPVTHVLGCHIEMTRDPGVDYPIRATYQPDEPPLQLTPAHLHRIRAAVAQLGDRPRLYPLDDLILWPNE
ncbi:MBL fold metallo-hydrolase [Kitasatospora sp. SUK 42]|uniref:MBL fold metallo-hydrolase n=1 Tax=Kitasatospora sp. SUK 42 TaxID=1588882 RepID=UPI0018C99290|nr:MBL fold metallo-hydrolase [Kitasatospora sp. SUK 42]MBV2156403.1 MBL fold metallo-hydrolase [Kitasatospora sp. SUK 42]